LQEKDMNTLYKISLITASMLVLPIGSVGAADQQKAQDQTQQQTQAKDQEQRPIFGWELMSVKERAEHREKMLSLKTEQERTAYRQEHHKLMQQRATERGVTIPDMPPQDRGGPGPGGGAGAGRQN
jgi:hypothetical protein